MEEHKIKLHVNGEQKEITIRSNCTLLEAIRDEMDLTGTKEGCAQGEGGACTVLVDGQATLACLTLVLDAVGKEITTIEGLAQGDRLDPVQEAFRESGAVACGYCIPGFIMAAKGLLNENPCPTEAEIREGINNNLCRCAGYQNIIDAIKTVANS